MLSACTTATNGWTNLESWQEWYPKHLQEKKTPQEERELALDGKGRKYSGDSYCYYSENRIMYIDTTTRTTAGKQYTPRRSSLRVWIGK